MSGQRRGFVCGGSWALDRIKLIDHWPVEETLARITGTDQQGGGSAHNFGVDMRKLDPTMPVDAIGVLGTDSDGDFLFDRAADVGIDTTQLHRTGEAATSYTDVMTVADTGKRTFFYHSGSGDLLTPEHFDFTSSTRRILHLGLLGIHQRMDAPWAGDANGWVTVLKRAQAAGLDTNLELVSIESNRVREVCLPCLAHVDTLIVNDHEIGSVASIPTVVDGRADPDRCREAALAVLSEGAMRLVAVHFPEGAICATRDGEVFESSSVAVPVDEIGSTVGAGDAFAAGMLYALHEDWPIRNAMELAHATAAISLRSRTTVGSVEDVDSCLDMAGFTRP
ncbi:MAG: carbohydrate kinase family protein [Acidimicrobiales bacterium]|nr:carbohydrate kinase family protein [Acidimicrobiales bacterium]RZV45188.1 MAG: carbohydrate kinase family protein [Acidimicrobiia bacterium]